jgi:hypothetical protein
MIALQELRPTQRRWRDLSNRRLFLGLVAAPVLPIMLGLIFVFRSGPTENALDMARTILSAAIAWSLVLGWAYLLIVSRWRGRVGRVECLVLGIVAAATLPFATISLLGHDFFGISSSDEPDATGIAAILAILLTPFGLLGGWCLWRLGVRPAVTTVDDMAPVFD